MAPQRRALPRGPDSAGPGLGPGRGGRRNSRYRRGALGVTSCPLSRGWQCPGPAALRLPREPRWGGGRAAPGLGAGGKRGCLCL